MVFVLLLLGLIAIVAGVLGVGLGLPVKDTSLGAAELVSASIAVTGGLVLIGMAVAVAEMRRVLRNAMRQMRTEPGGRGPQDNSGPRREPRLAGSQSASGNVADVIPARFDTSAADGPRDDAPDDRASSAPPRRAAAPSAPPVPAPSAPGAHRPPEGGERRFAEATPPFAEPPAPEPRYAEPTAPRSSPVSEPRFADRAVPPPAPEPRFDEQPLPPPARDPRFAESPGPQPPPGREPRFAEPHFAEPPPPVPEPPVAGAAAAPGPAAPESFDAVRSRDHRNGRQPPPPQAGEDDDGAEAAGALPPLAPSTAAPRMPQPVRILKSGVINEVAYTLFSDGTIESQTTAGTEHFASIDEFRRHLEKSP